MIMQPISAERVHFINKPAHFSFCGSFWGYFGVRLNLPRFDPVCKQEVHRGNQGIGQLKLNQHLRRWQVQSALILVELLEMDVHFSGQLFL